MAAPTPAPMSNIQVFSAYPGQRRKIKGKQNNPLSVSMSKNNQHETSEEFLARKTHGVFGKYDTAIQDMWNLNGGMTE